MSEQFAFAFEPAASARLFDTDGEEASEIEQAAIRARLDNRHRSVWQSLRERKPGVRRFRPRVMIDRKRETKRAAREWQELIFLQIRELSLSDMDEKRFDRLLDTFALTFDPMNPPCRRRVIRAVTAGREPKRRDCEAWEAWLAKRQVEELPKGVVSLLAVRAEREKAARLQRIAQERFGAANGRR
jgi:hypothetical protein